MMRSSSGDRLDAQPDGRRGPRALGHFVEHQADAPEVGAVIDRLAAGLLRRHVGDRSHHDALIVPAIVVTSASRAVGARIFARPKSRSLA